LIAGEMPDFLPLFLEYLSTQSDEEVHELLGQTLHIVANLRTRLQKRDSIYANAMLALEAIAGIDSAAAGTRPVARTARPRSGRPQGARRRLEPKR
jgi:nitrate reductase assembly molybdenum cofactor insertion protein NarJ